MKFTKITKRIWAMLLAVVMVVTSVNYSPKVVKADEYTTTDKNNGIAVSYRIESNTLSGWATPTVGGTGERFVLVYNGALHTAENTSVKIDGVVCEKGGDKVWDIANGTTHIKTDALSTTTETKIEVISDDASLVMYAIKVVEEVGETAPSAPEGFVANINDLKTNYTLAWATVSGVTYNFYIDDKVKIEGITSGTVKTFEELGVEAGKTYTFGLTAVNSYGESDKATISVTVPGTSEETTSEEATEFVEGTERLTSLDFPAEGSKWAVSNETADVATFTQNGDGTADAVLPAYEASVVSYATQFYQTGVSVTANRYYRIKATVQSDVLRHMAVALERPDSGYATIYNSGTITLNAGEETVIDTVFESDATDTNAKLGFFFGAFGTDAEVAANVTISNVSLKEYSSAEEANRETELAAPTDFVLYNFRYTTDDGYKAVFTDANSVTIAEDESYEYNIYVEANGITYNKVGTVSKSKDIFDSTAMDALNLTEGQRYQAFVEAAYTKADGTTVKSEKTNTYFTYKKAAYTEYDDIRQIHIITADNTVNLLTDASKAKANSTIIVKDADGTILYSDFGTANVRGNSTAYADKKAWNIKFNSKYDLFGMGSAKKWSLLANAFDKSLLRNKLAMELGNSFGIPYNEQCNYVDVYVNGTYAGSYLAIESVETGTTRVDIDDESTTNSEMLLEIDANGRDLVTDAHLFDPTQTHPTGEEVKFVDGVYSGTQAWSNLTPIYNIRLAVNNPGEDPSSKEDYYAYAQNYSEKMGRVYTLIGKLEAAIQSNDFTEIQKYMDVDSFVNFYLVSEIFKNQDIKFSSTRFFIKGEKVYAGPLWDFDLSSGNISLSYYGEEDLGTTGFKAQTQEWFGALMQNEQFSTLVKQRFQSKLADVKALYTGENNLIDTYTTQYAASFARNYTATSSGGAGWSVGEKDSGDGYSYANTYNFSSYSEAVTYLRTWLTNRVAYLEEQWALDNEVALIKGSDVVVSWVQKSGATGYRITYTPATASATALAESDEPVTQLVASPAPAGTETIDIDDASVSSYNFTANGIEIETNTDITVSYTTDGTDYTDIGSATYVAATAESTYNSELKVAASLVPDMSGSLYNYVRYLGASATASTEDLAASYAIDNNAGTRWASSSNDDEYLIVDLGKVRSVEELQLSWETASSKDFNIEVSTDGTSYTTVAEITNAQEGANRYDTIVLGSAVDARYVKVHGLSRTTQYGHSIYEIGIYGPEEFVYDHPVIDTSSWEKLTVKNGTIAKEYYINSAHTLSKSVWYGLYEDHSTADYHNERTNCILEGSSFTFQQSNVSYIYVNSTKYTNPSTMFNNQGDCCELALECLNDGENNVALILNDDTVVPFAIKVGTAESSETTTTTTTTAGSTAEGPIEVIGFNITMNGPEATIVWGQTQEQIDLGQQYKLYIDDVLYNTYAGATEVKYTFEDEGEHTIKITAYYNGKETTGYSQVVKGNGEVVTTTKASVTEFTYTAHWEAKRNCIIEWPAKADATGYAVYADGVLYTSLDAATTKTDVNAYAFANNESANVEGQKTTVGDHNIKVVALYDDATALDTFAEYTEPDVVGTKDFTLYVNYVYGSLTNIWNNTGFDSAWNFTICEDATPDNISSPAIMGIHYYKDGSATLDYIDRGVHTDSKDQAWTIKAALYDQASTVGELQNLSFNIYGPAQLIGQQIRIKCVPEECDENDVYIGVVGEDGLKHYEEKLYTFEDDGNGNAVLKYSLTFTAENDTYDLLFGLGLLDFEGVLEVDRELTFTDPKLKDVYGVTSVTGSGIANTSEIANSSILVTWTTDVPESLSQYYKYNVYIDEVLVDEDATIGTTYAGYDVGDHTVKVESIFGGDVTATKEGTATIVNTTAPDLVITDISIPEGGHYVGEVIPVTVMVKNIGNADADVAAGNDINITAVLYVNDRYIDYKTTTRTEAEETIKTIKAGESYAFVFEYTVLESDNINNDYKYVISAVIDADDLANGGRVAESNEDNNTFAKTYIFYPEINKATLTNVNDEVQVTWPKHEYAEYYDVTYVSNGETITVEKVYGEEIVITDKIDYNTEVIIYAKDSDDQYHKTAVATALPDLIISEVSIPKTTYGVGQTIPITLTMKNVGVATAQPNNDGNLTLKDRIDGVNDAYRTLGDEGINPQQLVVGDTFTYTFNYTVKDTDLAKGSISINGHADADGNVTEISDENNYGEPVVVTIVETALPDLIISDISIPKDSYAIGDEISLTITMKNDSGVDAELASGNLTFKALINGANYDYNWYIIPKVKIDDVEQANTIVKAGEEVTGVVKYTVKEEDIVDGYIYLGAKADAEGAIAGNGSILEADESNNILNADPIKIVEHGTVELAYNSGENDDDTTAYVSATWTEISGTTVTGYKLTYTDAYDVEHVVTINGENVTKAVDGEGNATYRYNFLPTTKLQYKSNVVITATYDGEIVEESKYYEYALDQALPDLIITSASSKVAEPKINVKFDAKATMKNVGTSVVPAGTVDDMEHYSDWLGVCLLAQDHVYQDNFGELSSPVIGGHTIAGLAIGESVELDINNIVLDTIGEYTLTVRADDLGYVQQDGVGHFAEISEDNNTNTFTVTAIVDQDPMDWTPLKIEGTDDSYTFRIAATDTYVEYKVLDTTIKDIGFKDIFNKYVGYNSTYISMGVSSSKYTMLPITTVDGVAQSTSTIHFSQVSSDYCNTYTDNLGSQIVNKEDSLMSVQNAVIVDGDGNVLKDNSYATSPLVYNGNGINYNVSDWGLGKYYVMVIQNANGDNITVAFRVTTGTGKWIRSSSDQIETDPDKLPFYYHRGHLVNDEAADALINETTGTFYYDSSDFGLSSITCYNQAYLSLVLDPSYTLPVKNDEYIYVLDSGEHEGEPAWKVQIAYASLGTDDNGEITVNDPGDSAEWVTWNGAPSGNIVGHAGGSTLQMKLPNIMQEIPVHSEKGGQRDDEYYFMRVYYDQQSHYGSYVSIPIRVAADIPMIEGPQNLDITSGSKKMTVSFGETTLQQMREYYYTINIYEGIGSTEGKTPVASSEMSATTALHHPTGTPSITGAGSYTFDVSGLNVVGNGYTVEVITEWCEQRLVTTKEYVVQEPEAGNVEVMGFQINANTAVGGVSEFAPSFRIVSRAAKQIKNGSNEICGVVRFGTVYAFGEFTKAEMTLDGVEANDKIYNMTATDEGIYQGYVSGKYNDALQNYFAMTIKPVEYNYEYLTDKYTVRAYAELDDGTYVYSDNCYTVSVHEIAENLYKNKMMPSKAAHEYLYNNVLNIVALNENSKEIAYSMVKTLGLTSASDPDYATIQTAWNEILWYTRCINQYTYSEHDGTFIFKHLPEEGKELLDKLNAASSTEYTDLYAWIKNQVPLVKKSSGVAYKGCYTEVAYDWENDIYDDFDME